MLAKVFNWYYDIHPFRPTLDDYKKKDNVIKQIKLMKQYKFKNRVYTEIPKKEEIKPLEIKTNEITFSSDEMHNYQLMKNKNKNRVNKNID